MEVKPWCRGPPAADTVQILTFGRILGVMLDVLNLIYAKFCNSTKNRRKKFLLRFFPEELNLGELFLVD